MAGFDLFKQAFPNCVSGGFVNNYYIASEGSRVSMHEYAEFCQRVGLPFQSLTRNLPVGVREM